MTRKRKGNFPEWLFPSLIVFVVLIMIIYRNSPLGFGMIIVTLIYLIPGIVAFIKQKKNRGAILALNILLGWTVIGWIISFIWSLCND